MYGHKNLEVWQRSRNLVKSIYQLTEAFPKSEIYCLTNQIRRAAISIPSNVAEGRSRGSARDFMRFVNIARGSASELETQLLLSQDLSYATAEQIEPLLKEIDEIGRMLSGLFASLEAKAPLAS